MDWASSELTVVSTFRKKIHPDCQVLLEATAQPQYAPEKIQVEQTCFYKNRLHVCQVEAALISSYFDLTNMTLTAGYR